MSKSPVRQDRDGRNHTSRLRFLNFVRFFSCKYCDGSSDGSRCSSDHLHNNDEACRGGGLASMSGTAAAAADADTTQSSPREIGAGRGMATPDSPSTRQKRQDTSAVAVAAVAAATEPSGTKLPRQTDDWNQRVRDRYLRHEPNESGNTIISLTSNNPKPRIDLPFMKSQRVSSVPASSRPKDSSELDRALSNNSPSKPKAGKVADTSRRHSTARRLSSRSTRASISNSNYADQPKNTPELPPTDTPTMPMRTSISNSGIPQKAKANYNPKMSINGQRGGRKRSYSVNITNRTSTSSNDSQTDGPTIVPILTKPSSDNGVTKGVDVGSQVSTPIPEDQDIAIINDTKRISKDSAVQLQEDTDIKGKEVGEDISDNEESIANISSTKGQPTQKRSIGVQTIQVNRNPTVSRFRYFDSTTTAPCWKKTLGRELELCQASILQARPHVLTVLDMYDSSTRPNTMFTKKNPENIGCSEPPEAVEDLWELWRQAEALLTLIRIELDSLNHVQDSLGKNMSKPIYRCFTDIQEHVEYASQIARYVSYGRPTPILSVLCEIEGLSVSNSAGSASSLGNSRKPKCTMTTTTSTLPTNGDAQKENGLVDDVVENIPPSLSSPSSSEGTTEDEYHDKNRLRIVLNPETLGRLILTTESVVDEALLLVDQM